MSSEKEKAIPYVRMARDICLDTFQAPVEKVQAKIEELRHELGLNPTKECFVEKSPIAMVRRFKENGISTSNATYGQQDANWLTYLQYRKEVLGDREVTRKADMLFELSKMTGWTWYGENETFISYKPIRFVTKEVNDPNGLDGKALIYHNPEGPAVEWADGEGIYLLDGILLHPSQEWIVREPENRTAERILSIDNTDLRTAAARLLGPGGILELLPKRLLDEGEHTSYHAPKGEVSASSIPDLNNLSLWLEENYTKKTSHYRLFEVEVYRQKRIYLEMICPSKGEMHIEAVHPDCRTIDEALAWKKKPKGPLVHSFVAPTVRT